MFNILKTSFYWVIFFLYYTAIVLTVGTFFGATLFPIIGHFMVDGTFEELFKKGASVGFRYASVWAGGISIVLCFMRGKRKYFKY